MSGRNYPPQRQKFMEESFNKERDTRLQWYYKRQQDGSDKAQTGGSKQYEVFRKKIEGSHSKPADEPEAKLPKIPQAKQHNRTIKDFSDNLPETTLDVDNLLTDMRPVTPKVRKSLYEGFSKDETGRYQYLHQRHGYDPEYKYEFPILSSWEYGWRLSDTIRKEDIKKPTYGRTRIVKDTFYRRTGVPDLKVNES